MPNIVYLWDFETGDTQGWILGSGTTLNSNALLQGTYSLYLTAGSGEHEIASISGVDLSTVTKPYLLCLVYRRASLHSYSPGYYMENYLIVEVYEGDTLIDSKTVKLLRSGGTGVIIRVAIVDISAVAGKSNVKIVLKVNNVNVVCSCTHYIGVDMIAIVDGVDFEYNTGLIAFDDEDRTIEVDVPDKDLSGLGIDRFAINLVTPDWYTSTIEVIASTDQGDLSISTDDVSNRHVNYSVPGTPPTLFNKLTIYVRVSLGAYAGVLEKVAVIFLDSNYNYKRIYLFNIYFTFNGISQRFISSVNTTTYGSPASGSKDINIKVYGSKFAVALKAKFLIGDPSLVSVGTVRLTVYSADKSTNYGSVTVDLTVASEQTTSFLENLPTDTDLVFTIEWNITASARIVVLIVPLIKVS